MIAIASALFLVACGRREECRALTDVLDAQRKTIPEDDHATTPAELAAKGDRFEAVAKNVAAVAVKDAELKKAQGDYVDLMSDQAAAARASRDWLMSADSAKEKASKDAAAKLDGRSEVASYGAIMKMCASN